MNRFLPLIVLVLTASIGLGMTLVINRAETAAHDAQFQIVADEVVDRLNRRFSQHLAFLLSARAFVVANDDVVTRETFKNFVDNIDESNRFDGLQGIGLARLISTGSENILSQEINADYGIDRAVFPKTGQAQRAVIRILEPDDTRNRAALGYDMFSEPSRREAMSNVLKTGLPQASAPVELVQEVTNDKQMGFLVYLPVQRKVSTIQGSLTPPSETMVSGFVFAPFRAGDLYVAAFKDRPSVSAAVEIADINKEGKQVLYRSENYADASRNGSLSVNRTLEIAGRTWTIEVVATREFSAKRDNIGTFALASVSLLLALALAATTYSQQRAIATAKQLQFVSEKTAQEKDLMLQEMKHRIKNSIARILAIARQTAKHSDTIDDFSKTFSDRMRVMADAQNLLTRSHLEKADLRELLTKELTQVLGDGIDKNSMSGPKVVLNERATQALGLTFHELATNAMKYSGIAESEGNVVITWTLIGRGRKRQLQITWSETSVRETKPAGKAGFGTKLIDANIVGELAGTVERDYTNNGLSVKLAIPGHSFG